MNKKYIAIIASAIVVVLIGAYACSSSRNYHKIIVVTGATPLALKQDADKNISLEVSGNTKKIYKFDEDSINAFASVYIRTREIDPKGELEGTYRYTGVQVLNILEGIAPEKPKDAPFDRPLDMVVTFISSSGNQAHFSYGEITMTDDVKPVILAYHRTELVSSKSTPEKPYTLNKHKGDLTGLRLICPGDNDTARYLDDVKKIVIREIPVDNTEFPLMTKGFRCVADSVQTVYNGKVLPLDLNDVETASTRNWFRTGHGQGFKGVSSASGYNLRSLLRKNFPGAGENNYFLFVACDGYRTLFSGREIFNTVAGKSMMLLNEVDGRETRGGMSLGPVSDYYVDRETWGLTHIMMIDNVQDIK
jgi:hypothetical protein